MGIKGRHQACVAAGGRAHFRQWNEKGKVQGLNDFLVFGTVSLASLSSGTLLHFFGWQTVTLGALPFIVLTSAAIVWLALKRRHAALRQHAGG